MQALQMDLKSVEKFQNIIPKREALGELANLFSVVADITRIRIISALMIRKMCVTDLSSILQMNQTTLSHQLRFLRNIKIVKGNRTGKIINYSIVNEKICDIMLSGISFLGY